MGHTAGPVALYRRFSPLLCRESKHDSSVVQPPRLVTTLTQLSPICVKRRLFQQRQLIFIDYAPSFERSLYCWQADILCKTVVCGRDTLLVTCGETACTDVSNMSQRPTSASVSCQTADVNCNKRSSHSLWTQAVSLYRITGQHLSTQESLKA